MARWELVAEGPLDNIQALVADRELPKGTEVKLVMDLYVPVAWAFDAVGAEHIFRPLTPSGMDFVDVYGEGASTGVVKMNADPAWLLPMLTFIRLNWAAILISGLVLGAIVFMARMFIKVAGIVEDWLPLILIGLGIVLVVAVWPRGRKTKRK